MDTPKTLKDRSEEHGDYVEKNVKIITSYTLSFIGVGIVFASLVAGCSAGIGIVTITAFSCCAIGSALGFLFSIPKSAQNTGSPERINSGSSFNSDDIPKDNTNLEQISDWLVKILIGASLVQLKAVKEMFESMAAKLSHCLLTAKYGGEVPGATSFATDPFCQPFCLFLILYFLTLGFLAGYLITRLWLPFVILKSGLAMRSAQRANNLDELERKVESGDINNTSLQDALDVLRFALSHFEQPQKTFEPSTIRLAIERSKKCLELFPTHRTLAILVGRLHRELNDYDSAIRVLEQFLENAKRVGSVPELDISAILYNLACYKNLKANQMENREESESLRQDAWEALKKSCRIDPLNRDEAKEDDDFKSLFASRNRESL